jgi:hypothetical protein
MSEPDDLVARRYRELRREVPSAALDVKVLAAARSAVAPRSFTRRWAAPLGAAAVVVLAVGVTLQLQHEEAKRPAAPEPVPAQRTGQAPAMGRLERAPAAIPFAPRRAVEPAPASPQPEVASVVAQPPTAAKSAAVPAAELRAKMEVEEAARRAAAAPAANALQRGPFTIDQATTAGVQVKPLPRR